jgi:hypothetical protein
MIAIRPRRILALAAIAAAAACHADSSVGPFVPATPDAVLAEISLPDIPQPGGVSFNFPVNLAEALPAASCTYAAATQHFDCPTPASPTITTTQWFMLFDAAGAPQSRWDAGTTDALRLYQAVHGHLVSSHDSLNLDTRQDLTVGGLLSGRHTLNGTQVAHFDDFSTVTGSELLLTDVSQQLANVVLNGSADHAIAWPLSGTLTSDIAEARGPLPSMHIHSVITFNGTSKVQATVTIDGVSSPPCTLDLTSPFFNCF